jgi:hypothetical protein
MSCSIVNEILRAAGSVGCSAVYSSGTPVEDQALPVHLSSHQVAVSRSGRG